MQQKNRMVHFENPAQLLDYFRLRKDGSQYRRMKTAFQRVFAATIFFGSEEHLKRNPVVDWSRFHFADQMRLWFNREDQPQPSALEIPDNVVVLSEAFYLEICEHPIPVEREVVAALAHAPGLLDFYVWITWKSWTLKDQPAYVPFFGLLAVSATNSGPKSIPWTDCSVTKSRIGLPRSNCSGPIVLPAFRQTESVWQSALPNPPRPLPRRKGRRPPNILWTNLPIRR